MLRVRSELPHFMYLAACTRNVRPRLELKLNHHLTTLQRGPNQDFPNRRQVDVVRDRGILLLVTPSCRALCLKVYICRDACFHPMSDVPYSHALVRRLAFS